MSHRAAWRAGVVAALAVATILPATGNAQQEFGRIVRNGGTATLSAFGPRPLEQASRVLAREFALRVHVEDPLYLWNGDLVESHRSAKGLPVMIPRPILVESGFALDSAGRPENLSALLTDLLERYEVQRPFAYRVDSGPAGYTLVPMAMRNEQGAVVAYTSPLDTLVTIPHGTRAFAATAQLVTTAVQQKTGTNVTCCFGPVGNFDYSMIDFEASSEPARHVLQRLMLLRPSPSLLFMFCQPGTRDCFTSWVTVR